MTVSSVFNSVNSAVKADSSNVGKGLGSMGASDFLKLLTEQMKMQDPTAPVDNKDMLAQMAQFSSLSSTAEMNSTLKAIATKLGVYDDASEAAKTNADTNTGSTDGVAA